MTSDVLTFDDILFIALYCLINITGLFKFDALIIARDYRCNAYGKFFIAATQFGKLLFK